MSVEQKHLKGLVFSTSEIRKVKQDDGTAKEERVKVQRPLVLEDILSQTEKGNAFVIVTKDGRKYTVPKDVKAEGGKEK